MTLFRTPDRLGRFEHPEELVAFLLSVARSKVRVETRCRLGTAKRDLGREQPWDPSLGEEAEIPSREPAPFDLAVARERWAHILLNTPIYYRKIIKLRFEGLEPPRDR